MMIKTFAWLLLSTSLLSLPAVEAGESTVVRNESPSKPSVVKRVGGKNARYYQAQMRLRAQQARLRSQQQGLQRGKGRGAGSANAGTSAQVRAQRKANHEAKKAALEQS